MKKKQIVKKILPILLVATLSPPSYAFAFVCVNCATNIQALQANIAQAKDYVESVQRTLNQIEQLKNQVKNLSKIGHLEWGDADSQLRNLANIAAQGQSLSFSVENLNKEWDNRFKGYDVYRNQSIDNNNSTQQYKKWGATLKDTSKSALSVANQLSKMQDEDSRVLKNIQSHTANAVGTVQVGQATNELLLQVATSLQKLQTLMQSDISMTATSIATATDKLDAQKANTDKYYERKLYNELNPNNGVNWLDRMPTR